jgi:hypothetical protein
MRHAPKGPIKVKSDPIREADPTRGPGWRGCTATTRRGTACCGQAIKGGTVCRMHGGGAPQVKAAALERLKLMQPKALDTIDRLLGREEFPTVQLAAAKDVLDRTEGKAMERVEQHVDGDLVITWQS